MAKETTMAREGGVSPINAIGLAPRNIQRNFERTFSNWEFAHEEGDDWFSAWKTSGDVDVNAYATANGRYMAIAYDADRNELKNETAKDITSLKRIADDMLKNVFARNETRIFEITLSNGKTQRYTAQNLDQVRDRFNTAYREWNGSYNGMPDIIKVNEIKLRRK